MTKHTHSPNADLLFLDSILEAIPNMVFVKDAADILKDINGGGEEARKTLDLALGVDPRHGGIGTRTRDHQKHR